MLRDGHYFLVRPDLVLVATGAREKSLVFAGNTLPGVYGAGAFQTLVNRDLVRPSARLFIVGGGNVGLIAGYHALQAGIEVVGLCEALPECGGYKVHADKLVRMGVPIYTSHTIVSANGREEVESVTIAAIDEHWQPVAGTEKTLRVRHGAGGRRPGPGATSSCARRASSACRLSRQATPRRSRKRRRPCSRAESGDSKSRGALGRDVGEVPPEWYRTAEVLKSRPGATITEDVPEQEAGCFPVFHCSQEIPCNPCTSVCPHHAIRIEGDDIMGLPELVGDTCDACEKCVAICPGLALTLVDYRKDPANPIVTIPYEFSKQSIAKGDLVTVLDTEGTMLGNVEVQRVRTDKYADRALLVRVKAPRAIAKQIAGIRVQDPAVTQPAAYDARPIADEQIVCRCERVTAGELRALIRSGVRDMNHLKAVTRAGMGACGGKTCPNLVKRLFREEGIPPSQVTDLTQRPLVHGSAARRIRGRRGRRRPHQGRASQARHRRPRRRPVMSTQTFDAVVVGAGSVGLPTAMYLAEAGLSTLVIEQFASAGQGSNKAAIGGIRATHSAPAKIRLCLDSLRTFSRWRGAHGDDIEWTQGGYVFVAYRDAEERGLKELLTVQASYGLNIRWLDRAELMAVAPDLNPDGLLGGTYSPQDGSASPLLSSHAFYKRAKSLGVQFRFNERVTGIIRRRGQGRWCADRQGRLRDADRSSMPGAPGRGRWRRWAASTCRSCRTATKPASPSRWRRSSARWSWTFARRPARATTTSTSTGPGRSSSASRRTRRSWAPIAARPRRTCR